MKEPLLSVIIPVFNTAQFIPDCLDSILKQTYKNIEVICVDDGSTDQSVQIIKRYCSKDSRVQLISQKNQGQSAARNHGMHLSHGKYITFLDSDDWLEKKALEQCVRILEKKNIDAVIYNMVMFLPTGEEFVCFSGPLYPEKNGFYYPSEEERCFNITNAAPSVFKRTSILYDFPEGMIYEDWVFMIRFFASNPQIYWMNAPLYHYRRGFEKSTTSNVSSKCLDLFRAYRITKTVLGDTAFPHQVFINDWKILNEGIGFVETRLLGQPISDVSCAFLEELGKLTKSFTAAYFGSLLTFIVPERRELLKLLRSYIWKYGVNRSETERIFRKLVHYQRCKKGTENLKEICKTPFRKTRKILKKCIFSISPSYRMATYNNMMLHNVLFKLEQVQQTQTCLEKALKKRNLHGEKNT